MADQKEFKRQKARLRDAILHDRRLTRAEQRIGYEIADYLNFRTGDAWPSQANLAQRSGYSVKTAERATKRLAGTGEREGLWFKREIDGKGYRYVPKFDQLAQSDARQNVGGRSPTFATKTPDIGNRNIRQNVRLSSLGDSHREPGRAYGQAKHSPSAPSYEGMAERDDESPTGFPDRDQAITAAAASGGAPRFVFEGSEPWRAWLDYRQRSGIPGPMPTRQHMVRGRWRTGWDVPTLWPPGYGRLKSLPRR
jgi:Helix-turn-helix domain